MKYARDVVLGDTVMVVASGKRRAVPATVTHIVVTLETGLYNPYTKVCALVHLQVLLLALTQSSACQPDHMTAPQNI